MIYASETWPMKVEDGGEVDVWCEAEKEEKKEIQEKPGKQGRF
jgi:hypothetical protein